MYKILVIGAVNSTAETIKALIRNGLKPMGVLGYQPDDFTNVSGWSDLETLSLKHNIAFKSFKKINDNQYIEWAKEKKPDIIFAVGFSQLLDNKWLEMPKLGCIGFHPTKLPKGRGRAPLSWLVLEEDEGASTFFLMGKGADDGPIFTQNEFKVNSDDDASTIKTKIINTLNEALDKWLPELKKGIWNPIPQDEFHASWYGKRNPEDGLIDWEQKSNRIDKLVKATTKPHPGAFTYYDSNKIIIWESKVEENLKIKGVTGRILKKDEDEGVLVQCGQGLLWIKKMSIDFSVMRVGKKLGFDPQIEIEKIWKEINHIKNG